MLILSLNLFAWTGVEKILRGRRFFFLWFYLILAKVCDYLLYWPNIRSFFNMLLGFFSNQKKMFSSNALTFCSIIFLLLIVDGVFLFLFNQIFWYLFESFFFDKFIRFDFSSTTRLLMFSLPFGFFFWLVSIKFKKSCLGIFLFQINNLSDCIFLRIFF